MTDSATVLVTGATGFAGSFLVEQYAKRGWVTHGTDRNRPLVQSWIPDGVALHGVDLLDREATLSLVADTRPDVVHHLAAQSSVSASWNDPIATIRENVEMQFNLLEAVRSLRPQARVLVVGSSDEYGDVSPEENPIRESQALLPLSPYAMSKVAQDLMGYQYFKIYGMSVVRVRPFQHIGPRRAARFVTGSFARQIAEIEAGERDPVLAVGNIDLERDFTDVRDVTRAYALVAEGGVDGEAYNVASGRAYSLRAMLETMLEFADVHAEIRSDTVLQRGTEPQLVVGDATKLRDTLGWSPQISFEESIRDTLEYWRSFVRGSLV